MSRPTLRRAPAALAVIALAVAGLHAASPAHAAPAEGEIMVEPDFSGSGPCTTSSAPNLSDKAFTDNGVTATSTYAAQGSTVANGNPADTTTLKMASTVKARLTKIGGASSTFTGTVSASASATPALAGSACGASSNLQSLAVASAVLPKPMWAEVRASGSGDGAIQAFASSEVSSGAGTIISRGSGTATGYLRAGEIQLFAGVQVRATTDGPTALRTTKQTGKFSVVLRQMGYAFTPSGAGLRYVALGSRKCSSDRVAVAFNSRVSKARAIAISVNGVRKMTFTGSTVRERVFSVPVKSSSKAKITATVVLDSGATVTAARSYLACS